MDHILAKAVQEWDRIDDDVSYAEIREHIDYLAKHLFSHFEPTQSPQHGDFDSRLRQWLESASDEASRKLLLRMVPYLFFIGPDEFSSLYRTALHDPITRWLIDKCQLSIGDDELSTQLDNAIRETWFCGITDSMQIAKFHHVNNVLGSKLRPDWLALSHLGDRIRIDKYMRRQSPPLRRIVLLEDFVGTGTQMADAVEFAVAIDTDVPVLLCPLIICPKGAEKSKKLSLKHSNLTYSPALELPKSAMLNDDSLPIPQELFGKIRDFVQKVRPSLGLSQTAVYGFKNTGALVVMYTNCPDNTLPIVWRASGDGSWSPLFPRSTR